MRRQLVFMADENPIIPRYLLLPFMPHLIVEIALDAGSEPRDRPRREIQSLLVEYLLLILHGEDTKS